MKKLAIFVEGYTEAIFVERFLEELANRGEVTIESRSLSGGRSRKNPRTIQVVKAARIEPETKYYVLIYNSGTDGRVTSDIRERYDGLVKADFCAIIGMRDVHPIPQPETDKLRAGLKLYIPTKPIQVTLILGVREIESWFLSEHTHFCRINPGLTPAAIKTALGIDVISDDMQLRVKPSTDLHRIYQLVGLEYNKSRAVLQNTVTALGYDQLYLEVSKLIPDLASLAVAIDSFLTAEDG